MRTGSAVGWTRRKGGCRAEGRTGPEGRGQLPGPSGPVFPDVPVHTGTLILLPPEGTLEVRKPRPERARLPEC